MLLVLAAITFKFCRKFYCTCDRSLAVNSPNTARISAFLAGAWHDAQARKRFLKYRWKKIKAKFSERIEIVNGYITDQVKLFKLVVLLDEDVSMLASEVAAVPTDFVTCFHCIVVCYVRPGGCVFLAVCVSVCKISRKVLNGFCWYLHARMPMCILHTRDTSSGVDLNLFWGGEIFPSQGGGISFGPKGQNPSLGFRGERGGVLGEGAARDGEGAASPFPTS